jgi:hypothetical protein
LYSCYLVSDDKVFSSSSGPRNRRLSSTASLSLDEQVSNGVVYQSPALIFMPFPALNFQQQKLFKKSHYAHVCTVWRCHDLVVYMSAYQTQAGGSLLVSS